MTREPVDLLIEARWLLPIAPANTVLEHHAVAVADGRIVALGPAAELRARCEPRQHVLRERHALLPGLVNAHARVCHALLRGLPVRGPRRRWLTEVLQPVEARAMGADFVRDGTRFGAAEMLRAGITCFADPSPIPEEAARAAAAVPMRAAIGLPVADVPTPWAENASAHLERAAALWDVYRADARITLYFAPVARPALSDATLARVRRVADELEARIALHVGELSPPPAAGAHGIADAACEGRPYGARPLQQLAEQGLLRPGFTAIGAGGLRREELELLARHGAALIGCPQADLRLGCAPAPLPLLPEDRTGLGTDSALAAGSLDLLAEARCAALLVLARGAGCPAPGDPRRGDRARARRPDRLARAGQGRRPHLPRPDRLCRSRARARRGCHRVRRDARPGERCVECRPRRGGRRPPARLRRRGARRPAAVLGAAPRRGGRGMSEPARNADHAELAKFDAIAAGFWDPQGEFRPLHLLNPVRAQFIAARVPLPGCRLLDVGCGGGLLAEALSRAGARVTGIDLAPGMIEVARLHAAQEGLAIDYRVAAAEELAREQPQALRCGHLHGSCSSTCPTPPPPWRALAALLRPGGDARSSRP